MNVLAVCLNRCHLGYLGCYGNTWIETPALDRLATGGCVFDQYYTCAVDGERIRRSWWTGRYAPPGTGSQASGSFVAELAANQGHPTVAIGNIAGPIHPPPTLSRGFARLIGTETDVERAVDAACEWLDEHAPNDDGFLWMDAAGLGGAWEPPEPFHDLYEPVEVEDEEDSVAAESALTEADHLRLRYAAQLSFFDAKLGHLLEHVGQRPYADRTAILFLSDYGLSLGEHKEVGGDAESLYEEVVHVPLIISLPGATANGQRSGALVQPVDLAPTIFELLAARPVEPMHGKSLVPLLQRTSAPLRDCAVTVSDTVRSIHTDSHHLIHPKPWVPTASDEPTAQLFSPELYLKPEDRWDQHDVASLYPDDVERLSTRLEQIIHRLTEDHPDPFQRTP